MKELFFVELGKENYEFIAKRFDLEEVKMWLYDGDRERDEVDAVVGLKKDGTWLLYSNIPVYGGGYIGDEPRPETGEIAKDGDYVSSFESINWLITGEVKNPILVGKGTDLESLIEGAKRG